MFDNFRLESFRTLNKRLPSGVDIIDATTVDSEEGYYIEFNVRIGTKKFKDTLVYDIQPGQSTIMEDTLVALTYFMKELI